MGFGSHRSHGSHGFARLVRNLTDDSGGGGFWGLDSHRSHSNMKQRLMPLYDKIMLRKRSIIETVNDLLKNVAQLVHTRHRSMHNFLMNLLVEMGAYCFFHPSQQSTSTTRCRTQTVSSPFGNSPNPIFSKAHQAATSMVARHNVCIRIAPFQSTLIPNFRYKKENKVKVLLIKSRKM